MEKARTHARTPTHKCTYTEEIQIEVAEISHYQRSGFFSLRVLVQFFMFHSKRLGLFSSEEFFSFYGELCLNTHGSL